MQDDILRSETYKSLLTLKRQYIGLSQDSFPCKGASTIWKLFHFIISMMIDRVDKYSTKQIQHINTLLPEFDTFCGLLDDSVVDKVPWSILPSLEGVFSVIRKGAQFIIAPQWEINYAVLTMDVIGYMDSKVLSIPNLIFDAGENFITEKERYLCEFQIDISQSHPGFNNEVYVLLYPRSERLSVLHFPLLGHEIGHIFASRWIAMYYENKVKQYDLIDKTESFLKENLPNTEDNSLFGHRNLILQMNEVSKIYLRIMHEVIADFVGAIIFGPAALLSSYVFSLKFGYDDDSHIVKGYLPWRFRLHLIFRLLNLNESFQFNKEFKGIRTWLQQIKMITENFDYIDSLMKTKLVLAKSVSYLF